MIRIPSSLLREIHGYMEAAYPHECCGVLMGHVVDGVRVVETCRPVANLNTERAHDRYDMDLKAVVRYQRELYPLDIVGFYHSHPDHPSRASQTDADFAWAGCSYVIGSVQKGTIASTQSWVLDETAAPKRCDEEQIEVVEGEMK